MGNITNNMNNIIDKKEIKELKEKVLEANIELYKSNLVSFTFGNVSGINRERNLIAIKPSGIDYKNLSVKNMVLVSLDGKLLTSDYKPSSDTKTHLVLYNAFPEIGGVAHTHSRFATIFAQALKSINCLGTTHADYFYGEIPCTEPIKDDAIQRDYEEETGLLIKETLLKKGIDYKNMKACLVANHGPFTWGKDPEEAVFISKVLEEISIQNLYTKLINPQVTEISKVLLDKHYLRKHGKNAYYGQNSKLK